jgi:hypothetical protein
VRASPRRPDLKLGARSAEIATAFAAGVNGVIPNYGDRASGCGCPTGHMGSDDHRLRLPRRRSASHRGCVQTPKHATWRGSASDGWSPRRRAGLATIRRPWLKLDLYGFSTGSAALAHSAAVPNERLSALDPWTSAIGALSELTVLASAAVEGGVRHALVATTLAGDAGRHPRQGVAPRLGESRRRRVMGSPPMPAGSRWSSRGGGRAADVVNFCKGWKEDVHPRRCRLSVRSEPRRDNGSRSIATAARRT